MARGDSGSGSWSEAVEQRKERRLHESGEIEARIIRDSAVLVGKPVVRGTRISVSLILNYLEQGHSVEELLDDYPVLTRDDVDAAASYGKQQKELLDVEPVMDLG